MNRHSQDGNEMNRHEPLWKRDENEMNRVLSTFMRTSTRQLATNVNKKILTIPVVAAAAADAVV